MKWEAIVNDPIGAILTGLILDILLSPVINERAEIVTFAARIALGAVGSGALGITAAYVLATAFKRDLVTEVLKTPSLIASALSVYVISNLLLGEAGLIAVTALGVTLANLHLPGLHELRRFKEALVVLIVSALFVVLTADLNPKTLSALFGPIVLLTMTTMILVRPLAIGLATLGSDLSWRERVLLGWIGSRGIVAAATAGVAGLRLQEAGYAGAQLVQPTIFALIAATVIVHGLTLRPLARRLDLTTGDKPVLALLGASAWATDLAAVLMRSGVAILLIDSFPGALRTARRLHIPVLQSELLSRDAEEDLAEQPIDYFVAATPDQIYNAIVCARLAPEIGRERVYQLATSHVHMLDPEKGVSRDWRGKIIGGQHLDHEELAQRYESGWRFAPVQEVKPEQILIIVLRRNGQLDFSSADHQEESAMRDGDIGFVLAPSARYLP